MIDAILRWFLALLVGTLGLTLAAGGVVLVSAGGSPYYLIVGIALVASGVGLALRLDWAAGLYGAVLLVTTIWALWESGLDAWALVARLGLLLGLGIGFVVADARGWFRAAPSRISGRYRTLGFLLAPAATLLCAAAFGTSYGGDPSVRAMTAGPIAAAGTGADWPSYAGSSAMGRFSSLSQIAPGNVDRLRVAWTYRIDDPVAGGLELTPIKIGNVIYGCSASNLVFALDATTGRELWRLDPKVNREGLIVQTCRGVTYYSVPGATGPCAERVFTNTVDARLIAIDARTGRKCAGFGTNGEVSLLKQLGWSPKGYYLPTSAPTLARGRLVVNGAVLDNMFAGEPSGVVRAYDAVTGQLSWAYDVGHPDRIGAPLKGENYTAGTANSWAPMAYDDALGLVYVPTGAPTPDYFGGRRRPIDEEIANAVMALDVETGRRRWVYQIVHHDLWDYDLASPPVLFDLPGPNGPIRALVQPSKRGEAFVLDRATGRPLDRIVERRVPTRGIAPGERISPTQPFPAGMPSFAGEPLSEVRMWGLTPVDQLWCRIKFRQARYEGTLTPPGLTPSIMYPGYFGGMNWGGVAVDSRRGVMVAVTNYVANYVKLLTRKEADAAGARPFGIGAPADLKTAQGIAVQQGSPYAATTQPFLSPLQVPCQQPPWSRITAVDLRAKRVLWSRPLGSARDSGPLGIKSHLPFTMGVPSVGPSLVTASGLTFVGASTDRTFRAIDTATGRILWHTDVPASANSGPMTYAANGRQFVVVAAGGHRILRSGTGRQLIAYALPRS